MLEATKEDSQEKTNGIQLILFHSIVPLLYILIAAYLNWKVKKFMEKHCPRNRMSCIGLFKRNVLTFKQTSSLFHICCFSSLVAAGLQILFILENDAFSRTSRFWIWNIKELIFNDGWFFAFCLIEVPSYTVGEERSQCFYVTKPAALEPRRTTHSELLFNVSQTTVLGTKTQGYKTNSQHAPFLVVDVPLFKQLQNKSPTTHVPRSPQNNPKKAYHCTIYCKNHGVLSRI